MVKKETVFLHARIPLYLKLRMINEVTIENRYISRSYYIRKCGGEKEGVFEEIRQCIVKAPCISYLPQNEMKEATFSSFEHSKSGPILLTKV